MALLATAALAALALPSVLAVDPNAPTLLFNWTLRTTDGPVKLNGVWTAVTTAENAMQWGGGGIGVDFIGNGLTYWGSMDPGAWNQTDSQGKVNPGGSMSLINDPTFNPSYQYLTGPVSDTVLWERSMDRFQLYQATLNGFTGNWSFTGATIQTGMQTNYTNLWDVPTRVEPFITASGAINTDFYNTTGRWEVIPADTSATGTGGGLPTYARCYDAGVLRLTVPRNTAFVIVNGTRDSAANDIYVTLQTAADQSGNRTVVYTQYKTPLEAVLYLSPLDPSLEYTMIINCVFSASQGQQGFTSMTFFQGDGKAVSLDGGGGSASGSGTGTGASGSSSTGSSSGSNNSGNGGSGSGSGIGTGVIVGIAVAAAVILIAALLGVCLYRRRRRNRLQNAFHPPPHDGAAPYISGPMVGEVDPNLHPTPYAYAGGQGGQQTWGGGKPGVVAGQYAAPVVGYAPPPPTYATAPSQTGGGGGGFSKW